MDSIAGKNFLIWSEDEDFQEKSYKGNFSATI
jgi:hypothetical protein